MRIKEELVKKLNDDEIQINEFNCSSKNNIFLVLSNNKKYILKTYLLNDSDSFNREKNAIECFSKHLPEVEPIVCYGEDDVSWILMPFFEGKALKEIGDFDLYKKAVELMIKLHLIECGTEKPSEANVIGFYESKLKEARKRLGMYLPKKYDLESLLDIIEGLNSSYKLIYENSGALVHGDFVDRNIIINDKFHLIDFENSRFGPSVEDLIFFLENSKLDDGQRNELIEMYQSKIHFDEKLFSALTLITKLRILGSLLRIKKNELNEYDEKIGKMVEKIKNMENLI